MNEIIISALGFCAATLTTIAFLPQVVKTIKTQRTKDISLGMYIVFTSGVFLWMIYGFLIKSAPVYTANIFTFILAVTILYLKMKHG